MVARTCRLGMFYQASEAQYHTTVLLDKENHVSISPLHEIGLTNVTVGRQNSENTMT